MGFSTTYIQSPSKAQRATEMREARGPYYRAGSDTGLMQGAKRSDDEADRAIKMLRDAGYGTDNTGVGDPD